MRASRVSVIVEDPHWRREGAKFLSDLRRSVRLALRHAEGRSSYDTTILLADAEKLEALNRQFRGQKKSTNVLSFPSAADGYLGDIAIAYGVTAREARESGKSIHDHALHLAVHGALHLLGYDHEVAREARIMEPLEIAILAELGIADPYAARKKATVAN